LLLLLLLLLRLPPSACVLPVLPLLFLGPEALPELKWRRCAPGLLHALTLRQQALLQPLITCSGVAPALMLLQEAASAC
jgi:hypothetical protein